jgi:hypothetical protein
MSVPRWHTDTQRLFLFFYARSMPGPLYLNVSLKARLGGDEMSQCVTLSHGLHNLATIPPATLCHIARTEYLASAVP